MQTYKYLIRAHHGMCLAYFKGVGYSNAFVEHMTKLQNDVKNNPPVCVTDSVDDICSTCPNNENGICNSNKKVINYDSKVLSLCKIERNTVLPFKEFQKLVFDNIINCGKRTQVCGDCEWSGICHF